jgi:hypothetical protein
LSYILSFVAEIKVFVAFPSVFVDRPVPFIFLVLVLKLVGLRLPITVVLAACFHSIDKKIFAKITLYQVFIFPLFFIQNFVKLSLISPWAKFMFLQVYKFSTIVDLGNDRMGDC